MANKVVAPVDIALHIKGAEKVPQLKGLFRDLSKTFKTTDKDIESVVEGINDYARSANKSEAVIKGQIKAFEGLREQARRGGEVYAGLSKDIAGLKAELNGSSAAIEAQRKSLLAFAQSADLTEAQIKGVIARLSQLRGETRLDSESFRVLGENISSLNKKLSKATEETKELSSARKALNMATSASAGIPKATQAD